MNKHKSKFIKRQRQQFKAWQQFMGADGNPKYEFVPLVLKKVYRRDEGVYHPSLEPDTIPAISSKKAPRYEGEMLEREIKAQEEIEKKKLRVAPLHKSNYIYITDETNPAGLGRKNEVL